MDLSRDFSEFLRLLVANDVRFMVVGGYALAAHGHPRYTKDLDVWVWADPSNTHRLMTALDEFGFGQLGLSAEDFTDADTVVQLGREPQRIDILTFATGLEFSEAYEQRMTISLHGTPVPFLSLDDLRRNKAATGRLRDLADLADLPRTDGIV